jgi:hypothetical protein
MDCREFRACIGKEKIEESTRDALQHHWKTCSGCRRLFDFPPQWVFPKRAKIKSEPSAEKMMPGKASGLFEPLEFKGDPVTFILVLDGQEEEIKIVEPEMDFPISEEGRLVVREGTFCLTDVKFSFNLESERPYELHFRVHKGIEHPEGLWKRFGGGGALEQDLNSIYEEDIVRKEGLAAWIEMTRGKARVYILYSEMHS